MAREQEQRQRIIDASQFTSRYIDKSEQSAAGRLGVEKRIREAEKEAIRSKLLEIVQAYGQPQEERDYYFQRAHGEGIQIQKGKPRKTPAVPLRSILNGEVKHYVVSETLAGSATGKPATEALFVTRVDPVTGEDLFPKSDLLVGNQPDFINNFRGQKIEDPTEMQEASALVKDLGTAFEEQFGQGLQGEFIPQVQ